MEVYKIDSIEDGIAAVEDPNGLMLYFSAERLPEGAKEGDCLSLEDGVFSVKQEETENRRAALKSLLDSLVKKD